MKLYSSLIISILLIILYFDILSASYFNFNLAYVSSQASVYSTSSNIYLHNDWSIYFGIQYAQTVCNVSPHAYIREKQDLS